MDCPICDTCVKKERAAAREERERARREHLLSDIQSFVYEYDENNLPPWEVMADTLSKLIEIVLEREC